MCTDALPCRETTLTTQSGRLATWIHVGVKRCMSVANDKTAAQCLLHRNACCASVLTPGCGIRNALPIVASGEVN